MTTSWKIINLLGALCILFMGYLGFDAAYHAHKAAQCDRIGGLYTTVNPNDESTLGCFVIRAEK